MRIAHLTKNFRPLVSGMGQVANDIAKGLAGHGQEVSILTALSPYLLKRTPAKEIADGFTIIRFPAIPTGLKLNLYDPYIKGLVTHLLRQEYNIIHCHSFHSFDALSCSLVKRKKSFKLIAR